MAALEVFMPPTTQSIVHLTHIPTAGFRMTGRLQLLYKASYAKEENFRIIPGVSPRLCR